MRSVDTDLAAERVQLQLLRNATVARRLALARSLSTTALQLSQSAIQKANPTASADELGIRFVALCYGAELAESLRRDLEARRQRQS